MSHSACASLLPSARENINYCITTNLSNLAVHIVKISNGLLDIQCVRKVVEYLDIFGIGLYLDIFHYFPGKYVVDLYNIVNQDKSLYNKKVFPL